MRLLYYGSVYPIRNFDTVGLVYVGVGRLSSSQKIKRDGRDISTVFATEIITDAENKPVVAQVSPLTQYDISILQFSVTSTDYDDVTRQQFGAKKEAFLAAEKSKADREKEVQERLMVQERGLREKAEAEASANVEKAKAVIAAQLKAEVAEQSKLEQETKASALLEVARIDKDTAMTAAEKKLEVAKLDRLAAEEEAAAIIVLAKAEEERIVKAGAVTEEARVLAEIAKERDIEVAQHLSKIRTPSIVFSGSNGQGSEAHQQISFKDQLMNMFVMKQMGILDTKSMAVLMEESQQE